MLKEMIEKTPMLSSLNTILNNNQMKYRLDDKEFKDDYEVSQYIEEHLDKWYDTYTNDKIEDLIQDVFSDFVEEI